VKLPLSWIREWVDVPWEAPELARRLTLAGLEVESLTPAAPPFTGVVVAKILTAVAHPQADKLRVCSVTTGAGAALQIVCGAPNARAGLVTALATIGAVLPGDLSIKAAKLRGVDSAGMLCSARELGLSEESAGILELPDDAPLGKDLRQALDLDDAILDISITPNRGDAMSVLGIAREIAALSGRTLKSREQRPARVAQDCGIAVHLQPQAGAARLLARVITAIDNTRASPAWLRERLRRAGLRSISPVVDVTNYVLLELGQPMHAYDLARLEGALSTRRAKAGERLQLLDGREVELREDVLVIADAAGTIGLAGIMGGARTAISPACTAVALEVAWFKPEAIAGRARAYGLQTDASQRFERGVDPTGQQRALERATQLLLEVAGGAAGPITVAELAEELPLTRPVPLRAARLQRLLGMTVAGVEVEARLRALRMTVSAETHGWSVRAPPWRFDIAIEADLIEEVVRIGGLDAVPEADALLRIELRGTAAAQIEESTIIDTLSARGFQEAITFAFIDPQLQAQLFPGEPALELANPIAADLSVMRTSLWPGLLSAARENLRRQQPRVRLFEIASRFSAGAERPHAEQKMLAAVAVGSRLPEQWGTPATPVVPIDFFDLKADLEAMLSLGGRSAEFDFQSAVREGARPGASMLHPTRSARVLHGQREVGWIGELHPAVVRTLDFTYAPVLFEIEYAAVADVQIPRFHPLSRFPHVRRDISFTVPEQVSFSLIRDRVSVAASSLLTETRLFDIYQGSGVETGRKSIALGLILQDLNRTLTDADADRVVGAVLHDLRTNLDARIRE
jgi:phenylalanyl-tRNA synthetase beta chain